MNISQITISEAKDRLSIPALWRMMSLPGEPPVRDGAYRSPFREDSTPSFSIYANGTRFKDHGTGEAGDAIQFLALARGIDNREACRDFLDLAEHYA